MLDNLTIIDDFQPIIDLVINDVTNPHTRRSYTNGINHFLRWWETEGKPAFCKDVVLKYKLEMINQGVSAATINIRIQVIRKLALESLDRGLMDAGTAMGIRHVKNQRISGQRSGNWLTKEQLEQLVNSPDVNSPVGIRDRAILSIMIGSGIRRSETANLKIENVELRDGRWALVDIIGKGGRVRSIPIGNWVHEAIEAWALTGKVYEGYLFYPLDRCNGRKPRKPITGQAVFIIVRYYARQCGIKVAPHDLRRSFAKLAYKGKSDILQIQASLGHGDPKTTMKYLGSIQSFEDAPADHLGLNL